MDGDTGANCDKAKDVIALDGVAALAKFILYIIYALINNQGIGALWRALRALLAQSCLMLLDLGSCLSALLIGLAREPVVEDILNLG